MFSVVLVILSLAATATAFAPFNAGRVMSKSNTLFMGSLPDTFKFKKIMNRFTFKTLAEAIEVAGLGEALSGGSFTIFAPTDNAFLEFFDATKQTKEQFLADPNLANRLKYHVIEGVVDGKALQTCGELKTLQGSMVKAVIDSSDRAFMNDEAKVETTDVEADNGIFHIIDYPLNPPKSA